MAASEKSSLVVEPTKPPGKWLTGLCDCLAEGCCGVCCAVCWCSNITTGQLYQRSTSAGLLSTMKGISCLSITLTLFALTGTCMVLNSIVEASNPTHTVGLSHGDDYPVALNEDGVPDWLRTVTDLIAKLWTPSYPMSNTFLSHTRTYRTLSWEMQLLADIASVLGFFASIITCLVVCTVRKAVRKRDGIEANCCGSEVCEDCCCACCCNPCTQCQIFRQEKIDCAKYQICSKTAAAV